ncbi:unnamed protein product [Durusdinium trenchii]|uniref:DNA polymerase n=1 Tax=Durusdinium trenchii TaxID=1381693 RepID=A0ABP0SHK4_9DINO
MLVRNSSILHGDPPQVFSSAASPKNSKLPADRESSLSWLRPGGLTKGVSMPVDMRRALRCRLLPSPLPSRLSWIISDLRPSTAAGAPPTLFTADALRDLPDLAACLHLARFHRKKFVLPDKENAAQKKRRLTDISCMGMEDVEEDAQATGRRKAAYSGGLVLAPKAGLYDDFVMLLDFNSLYPSIIQEHNICFTTVDRPDENEVAKLATEAQLLAKTHADGMADEGILPQVLRRLVDSRRQVKAAMKAEKNPKLLQVLEIRQKALKLTANSMYGCLGFQHSRFHARPLAALITAMGREALQSTISVVNQELQLDVVYGDTDSVFVNTKTSNFQQAMQIGEQIKRSVNKRYKKLEIEIDGVFVRLMLLKKKKYAAMKVLNWEEQIFEKEFKGLDIVRRDWCGLAKEMGEAILMRILDTKSNQEESLHWVHQYLADKSKEMDDGKVSLDKFIITKGLTKDPKDYPDAKTQPHVQVALRLISRGKHVRPGQEIGYVICNPTGDGTAKDLLAERARHPHDVQTDQSLSLDIAWYKKQQVHPLVSRILAVVEGTSSARLAECLGIDSTRFCQVVRAEENGDVMESCMPSMATDLNAIFDRKLRFNGFPSVLQGVKCKSCSVTTKWEQFLLGESSSKAQQAFRCAACQTPVDAKVVRNLWFMQLRRLVKEHGEGWVQPEESSCIEKTRRLNKGQNLVSEKTVYAELEFATHLCECARERAEENDSVNETIQKMNKDASCWLGFNSWNWLDLKHIFGSFNTTQAVQAS